jgi:hypothetical protein
VSNLIDASTASWNTTMVREIFDPKEADVICNMALSKYGQSDILL